MGAASLFPACGGKNKGAPRIAIVGAGIAGLHAAHVLAKSGITAEIYEAGARAGGRILTMRNIVAPGLYTEAGGEFVDTGHDDMMNLAREMGLPILDAMGPEHAGLIENAWYAGGRLRSEAEVVAAVRELTREIQVDIEALPEDILAGATGSVAALDTMSLEEYLGKRGVTGWFRDLLIAAYVAEFGLDAGRQSCLNLLTLISLDTSGGRFDVFGESDERYRIQGGSQALTDALAARHQDKLRLNHRLEAVGVQGENYTLSFQGPGGAVEIPADMVILALPFTLLRSVEFRMELPKRQAQMHPGAGLRDQFEIVPGILFAALDQIRICRQLLHRRPDAMRLGSYQGAARTRGRHHLVPGRNRGVGPGQGRRHGPGRTRWPNRWNFFFRAARPRATEAWARSIGPPTTCPWEVTPAINRDSIPALGARKGNRWGTCSSPGSIAAWTSRGT